MKEKQTVQIKEVSLSMELVAGLFEYINQINRPFTEKEPYVYGIREAINAARMKEEEKLNAEQMAHNLAMEAKESERLAEKEARKEAGKAKKE